MKPNRFIFDYLFDLLVAMPWFGMDLGGTLAKVIIFYLNCMELSVYYRLKN